MELLDSGVCGRIETLLDALGSSWTRSEGRSTKQRSVTYYVKSGVLKGRWRGQGDGADQVVFDEMIARLDAEWRQLLAEYGKIAAAMRKVNR